MDFLQPNLAGLCLPDMSAGKLTIVIMTSTAMHTRAKKHDARLARWENHKILARTSVKSLKHSSITITNNPWAGLCLPANSPSSSWPRPLRNGPYKQRSIHDHMIMEVHGRNEETKKYWEKNIIEVIETIETITQMQFKTQDSQDMQICNCPASPAYHFIRTSSPQTTTPSWWQNQPQCNG